MDSGNIRQRLSAWIIFSFILVSGYLVSVFEAYSPVFLTLLTALILTAALLRHHFTRFHVHAARTLTGLVFLFSGFVKGVDPLGTQYRIEDYFVAFGTEWALPLALPLSVILNAVEFLLGALLVLNLRMKATRWLVALVMAVFTGLTVNDALYNPVPDCGCFGDALVISNWQTLYKNLVIDALVLILFFGYGKSGAWFQRRAEWALFTLVLILFTGFQVYNIRHLPVIDFMDWKTGNRMAVENPLPVRFYVTFRNTETGEEKEYLSPDYPYSDSAWKATWEFVSQRVVDPNPRLHDLMAEDEYGDNHTVSLIENPDYQFLVILEDLDKTHTRRLETIRLFIEECHRRGIAIAAITGSLPETARTFLEVHDLDLDIFYADDVPLKAMVRANPGLILLKQSVVLGKWHYNDWPVLEEVIPEE